jgi:KaiC/GvpD/RAD55 family RecA-like ATPase
MTAKLEPPRFVIKPWLPRRLVTLIGGHGGMGKSYFALVIAAHVASGSSFAGMELEQDRVVFVSLEDEPAIVRYRLRLIIEEYQLNHFKVLDDLALVDGTATYAALMTETTPNVATLTASYRELAGKSEGAGLVFIDNASDAFDANENQRRHVRGFIRALTSIARDNDAAVALLAHIDKMAARNGAQGNSYSGSTAWHNSCRSRLAMVPQDDGTVSIEHEKNNLGPKADPLTFVFTAKGVPVPQQRKALTDGTPPEHTDQADIMAVFRAAEAAGINIPDNLHPGSYSAFAVLSTLPEYARFTKGRQGRDLAARAIVALKRAGTIVEQEYQRANRKTGTRLVVAKSAPLVEAEAAKVEAKA